MVAQVSGGGRRGGKGGASADDPHRRQPTGWPSRPHRTPYLRDRLQRWTRCTPIPSLVGPRRKSSPIWSILIPKGVVNRPRTAPVESITIHTRLSEPKRLSQIFPAASTISLVAKGSQSGTGRRSYISRSLAAGESSDALASTKESMWASYLSRSSRRRAGPSIRTMRTSFRSGRIPAPRGDLPGR